MAENLQIRIPVILGTENVLSEIDKIQRTVTQDSKYHLNVIAKISDNSISVIQGQLSALASKKYEVNIGTSVSNIQGQMSQVQNQIKTSIQNISQQTAIKPNIEIDKKAIDNMVNIFNSYFDISYKRGNQSSKIIKNELYNMMTDLYKAAQLGDEKKISSVNQQLTDFANTYSKIRQNPEAVQAFKDYKEILQNIGANSEGKISFNRRIYDDLVASMGDVVSAKKMLDSAFGVGKWNTHGSGGDGFGAYTDKGGILGNLADQNVTDRIITLCNTIIELRNNMNSASVSATEMMSAFDFTNGLNDVLKASGIKNQVTEVQQLTSAFKNANGEIQITRDLFNQFTLNGTNTSSLESMLGKIGINNYKVVGNDVQNAISSFEQFKDTFNRVALVQQKYQQVTQQTTQANQTVSASTQQATQNINSSIQKTAQTASNFRDYISSNLMAFSPSIDVIKDATKAFEKFGEVSATSLKYPEYVPGKGSDDLLKYFTIQVKSATGELQKFAYTYRNVGTDDNPIFMYVLSNVREADEGVKKLIISQQKYNDKIKALKTSYFSDLKSIRSAWEDVNGGKSVKSDENVTNLKKQYIEVAQVIRNLKNADETTMSSMKANVVAQIDKLNQMVTQYHNAEKVATQLRAKGFETVKTDTGNNIDKFINSINNSKVPIQAMKTEIDNLNSSFAKLDTIEDQAGKSSALTNILNMFDNAKTKFQSLKELFKGFGNANWFTINSEQINKIDDVTTKVAIYKSYLQSIRQEWGDQNLLVDKVATEITSLSRDIASIKTPEKLQEYVSRIKELVENYQRVKSNLDSQVESQNKIYQLQTQIAKLGTNDVSNKALLTDQLNIEQQKLNNLQMQGVTLKNIVSLEEQEKYVTEATSNARNQMAMAQNHANDKTLADNIKQVRDYETAINKAIIALNNLKNNGSFNKNANNSNVQTQIAEINALISQLSAFGQTVRGALSSGTIDVIQFANLSAEMSTLQSKFDSTASSAKAFQTELRQTNGQDAQEQKNKVLIAQLEAYAVANSKAMKSNQTLKSGLTPSQEINNMLTALKAGADSSDWSKIQSNFKIIRSEIKALGLEGGTIFQNLWAQVKKFSRWMGITMVTTSIAREIRGLFTDVAELDTALVDLRKTFKGTSEDLEEFYYDANDIAKQLGVTTKAVIDQASAWSRLGYNTKEAAIEMSKMSSIFASISPDMDTEEATDGLLSIIKAFDIDVNDVLDGVISKVNKVGNEFGTSNGEVVNMLTRSSSAMKEANNTLEETIALETAAVEITRDAESVGTAYKTLSMRLRGYDEETESYTNDVEVLSGKIADLTKTASTPGGISLFADETKTTYKSTVQLLREISAIYDDLSDKTQAELLEVLAGRRLPVYIVICA